MAVGLGKELLKTLWIAVESVWTKACRRVPVWMVRMMVWW